MFELYVTKTADNHTASPACNLVELAWIEGAGETLVEAERRAPVIRLHVGEGRNQQVQASVAVPIHGHGCEGPAVVRLRAVELETDLRERVALRRLLDQGSGVLLDLGEPGRECSSGGLGSLEVYFRVLMHSTAKARVHRALARI